MNEENAKAYLERKGKKVSKENVDEVMKHGKIYGDPVCELY
jgi:uncharacterized protein YneF (UPF0154 family)